MKKFTTKIAAISMAAMMALSMSACSINVTTEKKEDAQTQESVENPIKEVSEEEMVQAIGIDLPLPAEATDVAYSIIDMEDNDIAQVNFTLDGEAMYLRACFTNETSLVDESTAVTNFDTTAGDISGLNYKWNQGGTCDVQGRQAIANMSKKGQGYIAWIDVVPGILYNLCMEENADTDKLEKLATTLFVPMQGEAEADADVE